MNKKEFKAKFGFYPHEEECVCGWRRAAHVVWNTAKDFTCTEFVGLGRKGGK